MKKTNTTKKTTGIILILIIGITLAFTMSMTNQPGKTEQSCESDRPVPPYFVWSDRPVPAFNGSSLPAFIC